MSHTHTLKSAVKRNSFVRGMVRVIDLGCVTERSSQSASRVITKSDEERIGLIWEAVGGDLKAAISKYHIEVLNGQKT